MAVDERFSREPREPGEDGPRHPQRDHHRPGQRLGDRLLPRGAGVGRRPLPDPGRPAAALPDRAHRAVRRRLAADALRGRRGDRVRHRALLLPVDRAEQLPAAPGPGADRRLAADLLRPAVPPRRAQAAASARSPRRRSPSRNRPRGRSATRSSTPSRGGTWSTPPTSTRSTSRCGSSPTCSASRRRTGRGSVIRREPARGHQPAARTSAWSGSAGCSTTCSRRSTTHLDEPA